MFIWYSKCQKVLTGTLTKNPCVGASVSSLWSSLLLVIYSFQQSSNSAGYHPAYWPQMCCQSVLPLPGLHVRRINPEPPTSRTDTLLQHQGWHGCWDVLLQFRMHRALPLFLILCKCKLFELSDEHVKNIYGKVCLKHLTTITFFFTLEKKWKVVNHVVTFCEILPSLFLQEDRI